MILENEICFAKVHPDAIEPDKIEEDGGYDVYARFDQDFMVIQPGEVNIIPTGIATAFSPRYVMFGKERGSTGSKGMSLRMGVIDSGFRGEIKIGINNTSSKVIVIAKDIEAIKESIKNTLEEASIFLGSKKTLDDFTFYPYDKAIAQLVLIEKPTLKRKLISYDELLEIPSKRGTGMLGSSGK